MPLTKGCESKDGKEARDVKGKERDTGNGEENKLAGDLETGQAEVMSVEDETDQPNLPMPQLFKKTFSRENARVHFVGVWSVVIPYQLPCFLFKYRAGIQYHR